jgi:hypothetical protein
MQCRLPSLLGRFPLKHKTWLASAEFIDPKRDRLVNPTFQETKGGPSRLFDFSLGSARGFGKFRLWEGNPAQTPRKPLGGAALQRRDSGAKRMSGFSR